jgi:hypothetical protein
MLHHAYVVRKYASCIHHIHNIQANKQTILGAIDTRGDMELDDTGRGREDGGESLDVGGEVIQGRFLGLRRGI